MKFKAVLILLTFFSMNHVSATCLQMAQEYCCGYSVGDIQQCAEEVQVQQTPVVGGMKYVFTGNGPISGEYLADGVIRDLEYGYIHGQGSVTCSDKGVNFSIPKATLSHGGETAHGYLSAGISTSDYTDGSFNVYTDCSFTATDGTPVGTQCGGLSFVSCSPRK